VLAAAVARLLGDPVLAAALGAAARVRIVEGFTVTRRVGGLDALFRNAMVATLGTR
jgi:hypothetical protein